MSEHIQPITYRHVIACSGTGCRNRLESALMNHERDNEFKVAREHSAEARRKGWRVFAGRSRRWYCPDHGPSAGSTAREVS